MNRLVNTSSGVALVIVLFYVPGPCYYSEDCIMPHLDAERPPNRFAFFVSGSRLVTLVVVFSAKLIDRLI